MEEIKTQENEKVEELKKIKVIVKHVEMKEKGLNFFTYKTPNEQGKLIDLRFKLGNSLEKLNECKKAWVQVARLDDASDYYEFPRMYADGVASIEKIC